MPNYKTIPCFIFHLYLICSCTLSYAQQSVFTPNVPETVGFSAERLSKFNNAMEGLVQDGKLSGAVTVLARHSEIINIGIHGYQDIGHKTPMEVNSIFRIYSMTKPITGVAMMILYEEGKWQPNDPLSKYIPEFSNLMVYAGLDDKGKMILEKPNHPPTVGELMTHTAGFSYGLFSNSPVDLLYQAKDPLAARDMQSFITILADLPLMYQPGEAWVYSVSVDVQGYLVEKLSGQSLPEFMQERIFKPLGMVDTGFSVPPTKLDRLATVYSFDKEQEKLTPLPRDKNITKTPGRPSGGGGLYSSAQDYFRFAQMLANGGELGGVRILSPSTVQLMRSNHLPERLMTGNYGIGFQRMRPGFGFGFDVAVFTDPIKTGNIIGKGSYLWDGAAGTWFWVDPDNDVVFIGMIQRMMMGGGMPDIQQLARTLIYQALVDPKH